MKSYWPVTSSPRSYLILAAILFLHLLLRKRSTWNSLVKWYDKKSRERQSLNEGIPTPKIWTYFKGRRKRMNVDHRICNQQISLNSLGITHSPDVDYNYSRGFVPLCSQTCVNSPVCLFSLGSWNSGTSNLSQSQNANVLCYHLILDWAEAIWGKLYSLRTHHKVFAGNWISEPQCTSRTP